MSLTLAVPKSGSTSGHSVNATSRLKNVSSDMKTWPSRMRLLGICEASS